MKYSGLVNFSDNVGVPFHKWFRYREGFAGRLIEKLIKISGVKKDEMIIDPFCGSGTTPVVAAMNGYRGLGEVLPIIRKRGECIPETYPVEVLSEVFKEYIEPLEKEKLVYE